MKILVSGLLNTETTTAVRGFPINYYPIDYPFFGVNTAVSGVAINLAKAFVAELLKQQGKVCFVDEGTGDHPTDYEFHALAPAGMLSAEAQIISLKDYSGELFDQLLQHKIYDFLP